MRIPHELPEEFPDKAKFIKQLSENNYEFRKLASKYDEVNEQIYRIESDDEPTTDEVLETLKKRRLKLKDDIAATLMKLEGRT
ncbi:YdcH family protein [Bradyrhizobium cenepequi]